MKIVKNIHAVHSQPPISIDIGRLRFSESGSQYYSTANKWPCAETETNHCVAERQQKRGHHEGRGQIDG